jgi:hypothetical protein
MFRCLRGLDAQRREVLADESEAAFAAASSAFQRAVVQYVAPGGQMKRFAFPSFKAHALIIIGSVSAKAPMAETYDVLPRQ